MKLAPTTHPRHSPQQAVEQARNRLGSVLIVDDEPLIRSMLELELEDEYDVYTAENSRDAFEKLQAHRVDLVVSDINMPGMRGFELLSEVRRLYPGMRTALITAYNVDEYIRMAKTHSISNIIPKSTPFNFDEFRSIVRGLVTEEIFGLERYMLDDYALLSSYRLSDSSQIRVVEAGILQKIGEFTAPQLHIQMLLEELITNAFYHAPTDRFGKAKYEKHTPVVLDASEEVQISLGRDTEKYGVAVTDTSGRLTSEEVLFRIDRHVHGEGVLDTGGRGLHMSRLYADRLIVNVKKDYRTEVIFLNYLGKKYHGFKPLYITEI